MDRSKFTPFATGRLVGVSIGTPDWGFIPQPLPRIWDIPLTLWPLLASAKERSPGWTASVERFLVRTSS